MLQRLGGALEGDDTLALLNVAEPRHGRRAFGAVLGVFAASCLALAGPGGEPTGPRAHEVLGARLPGRRRGGFADPRWSWTSLTNFGRPLR